LEELVTPDERALLALADYFGVSYPDAITACVGIAFEGKYREAD
jgi:hypothetical protein